MRREFGRVITELAELDERLVLVVGDIGFQIFDEFRKRFPKRFLNFGICEQSMVSAASGMALEGLRPWVYTITPFLIERPFEQVKLDIDQQNVDVKLVGYADYPTQGPTHAEIDARKLMGLMKNIRSYFPSSAEETKKMVYNMHSHKGPEFMSLKEDKNYNANER